ncbi:MAG: hypothetical protein CMC55_01460 [Flavobacteriaceae bacterium]|nr:hypothetical protein [Flavobacteriaceae bacterium]
MEKKTEKYGFAQLTVCREGGMGYYRGVIVSHIIHIFLISIGFLICTITGYKEYMYYYTIYVLMVSLLIFFLIFQGYYKYKKINDKNT